jgi:hypothetical protein
MIWLYLAQAASKAPDEMEDIRPPVAGVPSLWLVIILATLLLLAVVAYFLWPNPKPKTVKPPLPREVAKQRLKGVKLRIFTDSGYDFSIEVSDILRSFIEQQFGIRAVRQTTIEFLSEASQNPNLISRSRKGCANFWSPVMRSNSPELALVRRTARFCLNRLRLSWRKQSEYVLPIRTTLVSAIVGAASVALVHR